MSIVKAKSTITHRDVFTLTGVNQKEILEKYIRGYHREIEVKGIGKKCSVKINTTKEKEKLDDSPFSKKYYLSSSTLNKQIVHTTNHDIFEMVYNGNPMPIIEFDCFYCRMPRKQISLGFPLYLIVELDKYIFHVDEPYYCTFNCLYSGLDEKYRENREERDIVEENIKLMFHLHFPDRVLTKAKPWRYHKKNHGTLTDEEFMNDSYKFFPIPSVILLPLKRQYIQYKA